MFAWDLVLVCWLLTFVVVFGGGVLFCVGFGALVFTMFSGRVGVSLFFIGIVAVVIVNIVVVAVLI